VLVDLGVADLAEVVDPAQLDAVLGVEPDAPAVAFAAGARRADHAVAEHPADRVLE
jgi:hypothetical protein